MPNINAMKHAIERFGDLLAIAPQDCYQIYKKALLPTLKACVADPRDDPLILANTLRDTINKLIVANRDNPDNQVSLTQFSNEVLAQTKPSQDSQSLCFFAHIKWNTTATAKYHLNFPLVDLLKLSLDSLITLAPSKWDAVLPLITAKKADLTAKQLSKLLCLLTSEDQVRALWQPEFDALASQLTDKAVIKLLQKHLLNLSVLRCMPILSKRLDTFLQRDSICLVVLKELAAHRAGRRETDPVSYIKAVCAQIKTICQHSSVMEVLSPAGEEQRVWLLLNNDKNIPEDIVRYRQGLQNSVAVEDASIELKEEKPDEKALEPYAEQVVAWGTMLYEIRYVYQGEQCTGVVGWSDDCVRHNQLTLLYQLHAYDDERKVVLDSLPDTWDAQVPENHFSRLLNTANTAMVAKEIAGLAFVQERLASMDKHFLYQMFLTPAWQAYSVDHKAFEEIFTVNEVVIARFRKHITDLNKDIRFLERYVGLERKELWQLQDERFVTSLTKLPQMQG